MDGVGAGELGDRWRDDEATFFGDFLGGVDAFGMRDFLNGDAFFNDVVFFDCFCLSFLGDRRILTFISASDTAFELQKSDSHFKYLVCLLFRWHSHVILIRVFGVLNHRLDPTETCLIHDTFQ